MEGGKEERGKQRGKEKREKGRKEETRRIRNQCTRTGPDRVPTRVPDGEEEPDRARRRTDRDQPRSGPWAGVTLDLGAVTRAGVEGGVWGWMGRDRERGGPGGYPVGGGG